MQRGYFELVKYALLSPALLGADGARGLEGLPPAVHQARSTGRRPSTVSNEAMTPSATAHRPTAPGAGRRRQPVTPTGCDVERRRWESPAVFVVFAVAYTAIGHWLVVELHLVGFETLDRFAARSSSMTTPPSSRRSAPTTPPLAVLLLAPTMRCRPVVATGRRARGLGAGRRHHDGRAPHDDATRPGRPALRLLVLAALGLNPLVVLYASPAPAASCGSRWRSPLSARSSPGTSPPTSGSSWGPGSPSRPPRSPATAASCGSWPPSPRRRRPGAPRGRRHRDRGHDGGLRRADGLRRRALDAARLVLRGAPLAWLTGAATARRRAASPAPRAEVVPAPASSCSTGPRSRSSCCPRSSSRPRATQHVRAVARPPSSVSTVLGPGAAALLRLTDSPLAMRHALPVLPVSVVGALWLARSSGEQQAPRRRRACRRAGREPRGRSPR